MPAAESYPDDLRYHHGHDWARVDGDTATFGVTWYAQDSLGDLVVYLPPEVGAEVSGGREYGELESVKAVSGIVAPLLGDRDRGQSGRDRRARARQRRSVRAGLADPRAALEPRRARRAARRGGLRGTRHGSLTVQRLVDLERAVPFSRRHIGPSPEDQERMLALLGHASLDDLARAAVPASILLGSDLDLPAALPEIDVLAELRELGHRNRVMTTMIGLGYYGTHTPQVVLRKVLENPAWYTAYTPYQPEISQGRLEALLNYQTMVSDLTGLPLANASLLDEATAAAEAMTVARRASKAASNRFVVDADVFPQTLATLQTRAEPLGIEVVVADLADGLPDGGCFGVLAQYPGVERPRARPRAADRGGARRGRARLRRGRPARARPAQAAGRDGRRRRRRHVAALRRPDRLRRPARRLHERPQRSRARAAGPPGRRLDRRRRQPGAAARAADPRAAHPPREGDVQHLHRAGAAGRDGVDVRRLPRARGPRADRPARPPADRDPGRRACAAAGSSSCTTRFFDTIRVRVPYHADAVIAAARQLGINLLRVDADTVGISCDEVTERPQIEARLGRVPRPGDIEALDAETPDAIPPALRRASSDFLTHPVFSAHRSETQMLRYLRTLSGRDVALDRSMIPLGSCTMKLNATTEMQAVSWPEFATIHPFAPLDQADGYVTLIDDLERWLCAITGYDAVSLQPNAGSQGEFAGLLAIRGYHRERGDDGARRLPDPVERARHERRERRDGRHARRRRRPATSTATSTSTTCARSSPSTPTTSRR